jgi:outer membrane PBP1 activator LpoA protein
MLAGSFRLDTAQLIPRAVRRKQTLLLAVLILAGCGHSSEPKAQSQVVKTTRFTFQAPTGWKVQHSSRGAAASNGSDLVQVSAFPLVRPYSSALFDRVAGELAVRMRTIAQETGGTITGTKTVTAGGVPSHMYEVKVDGHVDEYTFVLIGRREYQLLCRSRSSSGSFCSDLLTSFQPA